MLAATRTFARVRAASAPEAAISLRRFAAPAGAAAGPSDASGAPPSRGTPFPPPPPRSAIDPPLSPTPRARPGSLRASRSIRSPRLSSSLTPSSRRAAPDAAAVPADISASASPPGGSPTTGGARGRIPATIVRETYEGVSASYSVSHGDTLRGYPTMTLREMLASVDARYAAGAMPAERHVAQLVDKVADADDAAKVAGAMAKFRALRLSRVSSGRSSPGTTLRRDGYLGENALLMFISACARDSADPRRAMDVAIRVAEARHVHGVRVGKTALLALLARSVDAGQIARVYEIWRAVDPPVDVDAVCADAVVKALVRIGEAGTAEASARVFRDVGVGIGEETRRALEEAIAAEERGKGEEAEEATPGDGEGEGEADRVVVAGAEGEPEGTEGEEGLR